MQNFDTPASFVSAQETASSSTNNAQQENLSDSFAEAVSINMPAANLDLSAFLPSEAYDNTSINSVFALSPPNSTIPSDPKQVITESAIDRVKSIHQETKPGRFALYSDGGAAVCRICHSSEASCPFSNGEPLISPCHCCGSTGLYHRTCLERWLSTVNKDKCEICKFQYHVEREPKRLFEFLINPGNKSIRRHIISDIICWLILTPTAAIGAWLCISGALSRNSMVNKSETFDRVQMPTLLALATFLITTYLVWSVICIRYHIKVFRRWRIRNYRIRVLDAEEAKKKRRSLAAASPDTSDVNNNQGFQLRRQQTQRRTPQQGQRSRSAASPGTDFSTPWPQVNLPNSNRRSSATFSSPFVYSTRQSGPATIFEPRQTPLQEIAL